MNRGQLLKIIRGIGGLQPPQVIVDGFISALNFQQGVLATVTPPAVLPGSAVVSAPAWLYADSSPVPGASGSTYTFQSGDAGKQIYVHHTVTANSITIPSDTALVGPIIAIPAGAPVVANQTLNFGRLTKTASGGAPVVNTGGPITSATIDSGTNANHWQVSANGTITPSALGQGNLTASYTLGCTFHNDAGAPTATVTINTEANAYDIGAADATTATAQMTAACTAIGTASVATTIYLREGAAPTWSTAWYNSRNHTALVTTKARTRRTGTLAGILKATSAVGWGNLAWDGVNFSAQFLRNVTGPSNLFNVSGTCGLIDFHDCDMDGGLTSLPPGVGFFGFLSFYNIASTNLNNLDIRYRNCSIHGFQRCLVSNNPRGDVTPGPKVTITDCDIFDAGSDHVYTSGYWQSTTITGNYIHAPYVDTFRVEFPSGASSVWKKTGAFTGAANGKKLFEIHKVEFYYNTSGAVRTLRAEGGVATPTLKIWRDTSAKINCIVRDTLGATVCSFQSANTYGLGTTGGTPQLLIRLDIDTDRDAQFDIWCETNGGGGSWVESLTQATTGQTLNLTAGSISFGGNFDGSESGSGFLFYRRYATWYGVAPGRAARTNLVSDTTGLQPEFSTLAALYGNPIGYMEGTFQTWRASGNRGTGGQWTTLPQTTTFEHGDLCQTAFGATVTNVTISDNVFWAAFDTSVTYVVNRPIDPTGTLIDYEFQGPFLEDMNANHYNTGFLADGNIVVTASKYGLAPYNGLNILIQNNVLFITPDWLDYAGIPYTTANWPKIFNQPHPAGTSPSSGNVIINNIVASVSSYGVGDVTTPNETGITPATNGLFITAGSIPTTKAELLVYATPV